MSKAKPGVETDRARARSHKRKSPPVAHGVDASCFDSDTSWHGAFCDALRAMPNVKRACEAASVGRKTAYDHRERYPDFAAEWDRALEDGKDEIRKRIQARLEESDRILELAARLWLPEYKDKLELSGKLDVPPALTVVVKP